MAKLSSINKNEKRKALVKKYAAKYAKLKAIAEDESRDEGERLIARLKLAEIPRNGNPTRVRNRCATTGRPVVFCTIESTIHFSGVESPCTRKYSVQ